MNEAVDVAIVGAGPYGLSLGAHLRKAGVSMRQFGDVMSLWRDSMPVGMFLKSQGFASNLSSPEGTHMLGAFCAATGRPYADYGLPVPIDTFVRYGEWFASELVPDIEDTRVTRITAEPGCFDLTLATGERARARRVVIAAGVEHFARMPAELAGLPADIATHASAHADLAVFRGKKVVVLGAGQAALETAALLHEQGTEVQIVMRKPAPVWNGMPLAPDRPLAQRMIEPEAGLGSGWGTWFYSRKPQLFRRLPEASRIYRARTALGPAGASWLRPRVEGEIPISGSRALRWAKGTADGITMSLDGPSGSEELSADHVIAATGFRADVSRLAFLDSGLRAAVRTVAGTPMVGKDYQSSVPGLYFMGPAVAPTFGPVMRFVYGADHAARDAAPALIATAWRRTAVPAGAAR
jgi:NADPH-dependent 2,4-dienoyl-CoA reductase/sulfur reductase-like enzyme